MKNKLIKYFSYLLPITVLETESDYHDLLQVQWYNGKKMLNTKNANYSFGSLHKAFEFGFSKHAIKLNNQDSVLILGFGAGSVNTILRNKLNFNGEIKGVEIDSTIIDIAKEHFNLPKNSSIFSIINDDANHFIDTNSEKFNLIVIDLFHELSTPVEFLKTTFIFKLKQKLKSTGKMLFNIVGEKQLELLTLAILKNQLKHSIVHIEIYGTTNYQILITN